MTIIMDGKKTSLDIREGIKERLIDIEAKEGIKLGLASVIVGNDPASASYIKNKERICIEAGLNSFTIELEESTTEEELLNLIKELNAREDVHGILVQVPLPKHINEDVIAAAIDYKKDVDGFNPINSGKLFRGENCLIPCTAKGIIRIIKEYGIDLSGKKAVVIGRSNIVGKPVAMLLNQLNATVTICHSRTANIKEHAIDADIIVSAVGKPKLVTADMVKEGVVVVDAGTTFVEGKLVGDVDFNEVSKKAGFITPVPGGVGAMTTTMLIENVLEASNYNE